MEIYCIRDRFGNAEIFKVNISKETDKRYYIDDSRSYRECINKTELYCMLHNCMFGVDKEKLVSHWNAHLTQCIREYDKRIENKERLMMD